MVEALLVIDVQVQLVDAAPDGASMVERLAGLVAQAHEAGVPVIFVRHDGDDGVWLIPDTHGWQVDPRLGGAGSDLIIRKRACDAFIDTTLGAELAARGIDRLVIGGMQTEYCVDTTVRRAVAEGYNVTLIADGHTTLDSKVLPAATIVRHHNATLNYFGVGDATVSLATAAEIRFGA